MSELTAEGAAREPSAILRDGIAALPLVVVGVLLLSTATDILPGNSLIGVGQVQLNLARILIIVGLIVLVSTEGLRGELFRAGVGLPLLLLLAVALLSSHKFGTYPRYRFLVEGVAAFYLTFAVVRARPDARDALAMVGLVALGVVALTAVTQVAQGQLTGFYRHGCTPVTQPFTRPPAGSITRAIGTFANPNVMAGYLLLLIPVGGLAARLFGRVRGLWPALVLTLGLGYLAVIFTYSRAAVLLSIALIGVGVALSRVTHRRYLIVVALGLAIAVSFLVSSCGSDATAGYGRATEWRQTLEVVRDNPVYGVGLGRLGAVLHARNVLSSAKHAHNLFLTWWAEAGTGALIAWAWLALALLWRSLRAARAGEVTSRAALLALLGFFGYSMVDHPANVDQVALAFWIVAGIAAASSVSAAPRRARWRDVLFDAPSGGRGTPDDEHGLLERPRTGNVRVFDEGRRAPGDALERPYPAREGGGESPREAPDARPASGGRAGRFDFEDEQRGGSGGEPGGRPSESNRFDF